jgi:integrase
MSNLIIGSTYQTLIQQLEKLRKHNRQGSIKTKERYYQAMQRFCKYLSKVWRLQKLSNIAPKHIEGYTDFLKKKNIAASTIKTDLAAIRFFHDKMSEPRHFLPNNTQLDLSRRQLIGYDRLWNSEDISEMCRFAEESGHKDYVHAMELALYAGLRIHECCRLDTATTESALKSGLLIVKGKNGKVRTIPIDDDVKAVLRELLKVTDRGEKLLVPKDMPTHKYIKQIQHFISKNRNRLPPRNHEFQEPLTFHGLRHTFAYRKHKELVDNGMKPRVARMLLSKLLGHERGDVTEIYLTGFKSGGGQDE